MARGVQQGDPLSARLYVIIAEVLGNLTRSNIDINGITINSIEQKILQYADNTEIIVTQRLMYRKLMGKWKNRHDKPFDCKSTNDKVFTLGFWIGNKETSEIIFTEQLAKIKSKVLSGNPENFL